MKQCLCTIFMGGKLPQPRLFLAENTLLPANLTLPMWHLCSLVDVSELVSGGKKSSSVIAHTDFIHLINRQLSFEKL